MRGACEGEKRMVDVPPSLAHGEEGVPGVVPPNSEVRVRVTVRCNRLGNARGRIKGSDTDLAGSV